MIHVKLEQARPYDPPKHHNMVALRLQHKDITGVKSFWVGLSHFLPGGGAEETVNDADKVYVLLSGKLSIIAEDGKEFLLEPLDSIYIAVGEKRRIINKTNMPATMLVISAYPEK